MILWWSKYYIKTNLISTLNNLVQAIIKKIKVNSILVLNLSLYKLKFELISIFYLELFVMITRIL